MKKLAALATFLLLSPFCSSGLLAQNLPTEIIGSHYHDPDEKAAESYSRGMKAKRKAEGESDPEKKKKLLLKAKDELSRSIGYVRNFDALLALGQVYLALNVPQSAQDSCQLALGYKRDNVDAQACVDQSAKLVLAAKSAAPAPPQ